MAGFNALNAVGVVTRAGQNDEPTNEFLGSCFAFREDRSWLTAAHCVGELEGSQLGVFSPSGTPLKVVQQVIRHPTADLAILKVVPETAEGVEPFWQAVGNYALGEEFFAFGYPENVLGRDARMPTARLFKGHYQRFFEHRSHMGYRYLAGEMNIPAPAGLSGGPLFRPGAEQMVVGVAAENFDSTTTLEAVEETSSEGSTVRTHYQRVVSYGVAALLDPVAEWLDEHLPRFDAGAYAERERRAVEAQRLEQ